MVYLSLNVILNDNCQVLKHRSLHAISTLYPIFIYNLSTLTISKQIIFIKILIDFHIETHIDHMKRPDNLYLRLQTLMDDGRNAVGPAQSCQED